MYYLKGGICQQKGIRVGQADIFCSQYAQASCNEQRILAPIEHTCKIIYGSIRIRTSHAFYEGGNDVVVHFATLVINGCVFLEARCDGFVVYGDPFPCRK